MKIEATMSKGILVEMDGNLSSTAYVSLLRRMEGDLLPLAVARLESIRCPGRDPVPLRYDGLSNGTASR